MPQTWDEKGNPVAKPAMPPIMPGSAAANPNAPAVPKVKQSWDEHGKPIQATPSPAPKTTEPAKPEGAVSKFFGAGPAVPAKPLTDQEKQSPFKTGVVTGAMLDPEKIAKKKNLFTENDESAGDRFKKILLDPYNIGNAGQIGEVARQMAEGASNWIKSIGKDPLHVGDPVDAMVKGQAEAYRKVRDGFKSNDHDMLMNGLGEAVGNLSVILGGAKSAKEGLGVTSTARDASFAAKDLATKRSIVSAASHAALDTLKDTHSQALDSAVKAERQRIGGAVQALNTKDLAADPNGYVPQKLALATLDQAISDKKADVLFNRRMLPKVAQVRGLLDGHTGNLTFNDLKQVRTVVGDLMNKSHGVEKAIFGDYYSSLSKNMKGRAAHLGGLDLWEDFNSSTEKLADHERGLIKELQGSKTGLDYAKKIASEQNQGRLNTLSKDLRLTDGFFSEPIKSHKAIINFAKMTEGDSLVAKTANRLIALKQHPIAASLGGATGVTLGRALGTAVSSPMAGSFIGLTLGAALAHDLMSKYDAAKAIREIGGPGGVMGVRPGVQNPPGNPTPFGGNPPASQGSPTGPGGPGGGGPSPAPPNQPSGSPSPSGGLSPTLAKLLPSQVKITTDSLGVKWAEGPNGVRVSVPKGVSEAEVSKYVERKLAEQEKMQGDIKAKTKPAVTKVPEGQHGREPSARSGMTKDTPEARRAKARERIAARREESSRTHIKGSMEDQARQVAGKMDFQGRSNIELEQGLQELYGANGKRFLKQFQQLARQQKWSEEVYRGYLEDTLDRRAKELASKPSIPGLTSEPKVE